MTKLYGIILAALIGTAGFTAQGAGGLTHEKERNAATPLRFRHARPAAEGLYGVPVFKRVSKVPTIRSTAGMPELIANCTSSKIGHGMYSFFAEPTLTIEKVGDTPAFFGGAVYVNGKYYAADYDYNSDYELEYVRWYVYDAMTWRCEKTVENPLDYSYIATDRTYDSTTGTVYSITYDKSGTSIWLSKTSLADGASTLIAPMEKDVIMIAADNEGQLYGIDTSANLYKIGKTDAALSLVGNTGIYEDYLSEYTQSITFDPASGHIYWAEFHSEGLFSASAALFDVDPSTARTLKVADIPGAPEFIGMYVTEYVQAGVPEAVGDLSANPSEEGSLEYTFSFTAPSRTTDGKSLLQNMTAEVTVDGDLIDILDITPGQKVETGKHILSRGLRTVKVTVENSIGVGPTAVNVFYAGYDVPAAPQNVKFAYTDGHAKVTWSAPTTGAEGGSIRKPITYNVTRMPGAHSVATGISGTSYSEPLSHASRYSYEVTAVSPDGIGSTGVSNSLVAGSFGIPYATSFDTQEEFDTWTVVDVTSGGKVWNYDEDNHRLRHPWSMDNEIDDYIISPGLRMDASKTYLVSFDAYQMVSGYDEHVMLYFGSSQNPDEMTFITDTGKLGESPSGYEGTVAPSSDGIYYIAFRSKTGRNGFMSYVDNVRVVEKGSSAVASGVQGLNAKAADGGKLEVTVSFDAPEKTMQGSPLESISHIDIIRGDGAEPIKTFESPVPGSHLEWTDTSVRTGRYTYRVIAYTTAGAGEPASIAVYAGIDIPGSPSELRAEGEEGSRKLVWIAPESGVNGGNLTGVVSYTVIRVVNDDQETSASGIVETEYTDSWTSSDQAFVYYMVKAVTDAGESDAVSTRSFAVGNPYTLPYYESFADAEAQTKPWAVEQVTGMQGSWTIAKSGEDPYVVPADKDGGLATFDGYHSWTNGCELRLVSPTIDISKYSDSRLSFQLYHYNGSAGWWQETPDPVGETLQVEISVDGADFEKIPDSDYTLYADNSGWEKHELALDSYCRSKGVRIAFRGKGAGTFNIHIDDIAIDGKTELSAIEETPGEKGNIYVSAGEICYEGIEGGIRVYRLSGILVAEDSNSSGVVSADPGIYVVVSASDTCRVIVK